MAMAMARGRGRGRNAGSRDQQVVNVRSEVSSPVNVPQSGDARRHRSMGSLDGIQSLNLSPVHENVADPEIPDDINEVLSPEASIMELRQRSAVRTLFSSWVSNRQTGGGNSAPSF
jgi:hypothetical protein